jgi:hypothetical protein
VRFVPYQLLADTPHVVVDGAPSASTVLTLSHWPATPTPAGLAEDTSAEIAFRYLDESGRWPRAEVVSNDHLDQDGLVSVFALLAPEVARERRAFLEDVARAGDFAVFADRDAARVSFALASLADPDRSPLGGDGFARDYAELCGRLYPELLGRLPELMGNPERHHSLWAEEEASLAATEAALTSGRMTLEELRPLDLAVLTVPEDEPIRLATRFVVRADSTWHPAAVFGRTDCLRLLVVGGRRYELLFRYESWVRLVSRRPLPRVDLAPLAHRLDGEEANGTRWAFDGVAALTPSLRIVSGDESSIAPRRFRSLVESFLASAPPAWDPYRAGTAALSAA